jgi:hypothetical protein
MSWTRKVRFGAAGLLFASVVASASCGGGGGDDGASSSGGPGGVDPNNPDGAPGGPGGGTVPLTTHPRLLVRGADLDRLRSWAVDSNPIWSKGLNKLASDAKQTMDKGDIAKDDGAAGYADYPTEGYAELFAFMSLVAPAEQREDYAQRAKKLLMTAINEAAKGVSGTDPFRAKNFAISDRSRWHGDGFGLTVDWIYDHLTAEDKATIRTVFLRWADELTNADTTSNNHPEPVGVVNDPRLISDPINVRFAGNNYYGAHIRNLALMSLSFDPADDPSSQLGSYVKSVTGAWLYVYDALIKGDMAGGVPPEGFEYGPQAFGYTAETLAALYTSGHANPAVDGPQTTFDNPFWDNVIPGYLHSMSSTPTKPRDPTFDYLSPVYSQATYGDTSVTNVDDSMPLFGSIAIRDILAQNTARLGQIRWLEANTPPGGIDGMSHRASDPSIFTSAIYYFMVFDPAVTTFEDPRPAMPLWHYSPGLGRLLARTGWDANSSWLTYKLSWNTIDHQHADGNLFELFRRGEWLTKERSGYGLDIAASSYKNALTIQNDVPKHHDSGDYREIMYSVGSQWLVVEDEGRKLLQNVADKYVSVFADATALYNSAEENATDVAHASRSLVWLKPDRVVVYDRAASKTAGRYKRFWLNLPYDATTVGGLTTMPTPGGQKLYVKTLLPAGASIAVENVESLSSEEAGYDVISQRLHVEDPASPLSVRFLNVLQGADGGTGPDAVSLVTSTAGTPFAGAKVNGVVVMFPVDVGALSSVTFDGGSASIVTGLTPGATYAAAHAGASVTVTPNGDLTADASGAIVIGTLP